MRPETLQKPHPPFVIGGGGEQRTLRVVAQYADIWNFEVPYRKCIPVPHSNDSPIKMPSSIGIAQPSVAILPRLCARCKSWPILRRLEGTRQMLDGFVAAGVTHIVLMLRPPYPAEIVQRLAEEIARPLVEAQAS